MLYKCKTFFYQFERLYGGVPSLISISSRYGSILPIQFRGATASIPCNVIDAFTVCLPSTKYLGWVVIFRSNIAAETPSDPPAS